MTPVYTYIKIERLRKGEFILPLCYCCYRLLRSRLLGCGGPTPSRRRKLVMQSYPPRALDRRFHEDWVKDAREGPKVLMSLRVDFGPRG